MKYSADVIASLAVVGKHEDASLSIKAIANHALASARAEQEFDASSAIRSLRSAPEHEQSVFSQYLCDALTSMAAEVVAFKARSELKDKKAAPPLAASAVVAAPAAPANADAKQRAGAGVMRAPAPVPVAAGPALQVLRPAAAPAPRPVPPVPAPHMQATPVVPRGAELAPPVAADVKRPTYRAHRRGSEQVLHPVVNLTPRASHPVPPPTPAPHVQATPAPPGVGADAKRQPGRDPVPNLPSRSGVPAGSNPMAPLPVPADAKAKVVNAVPPLVSARMHQPDKLDAKVLGEIKSLLMDTIGDIYRIDHIKIEVVKEMYKIRIEYAGKHREDHNVILTTHCAQSIDGFLEAFALGQFEKNKIKFQEKGAINIIEADFDKAQMCLLLENLRKFNPKKPEGARPSIQIAPHSPSYRR